MKNKKPYNNQPASDENIKDMFQNFQAPYNPESWDLLSQKMDSALPFVSLNDTEIKEDLANVTVPFDSTSWNILEQRLDLFDSRKKWILRGKIVELTMFFFVFYLFADSFGQVFKINQNEIEIASEDLKTNKSADSEASINKPDLIEAVISVDPGQNKHQDILLNAPDSEPKKIAITAGENNSKPLNTRSSQPSTANSSKSPRQSTTEVSEMNADSENFISETPNALSSSSESTQITEEDLNTEELHDLTKLPLLLARIEKENQEQNDLTLPVLHPGNFNDKKFSFLIGAVIGYDKDLIKSPFPHQKSEVMLGRIEDNFRMGLNVSMDMNVAEISTGVHYLIKNYKSVYAGENQVRIAHIPIMLKLKLPFAGFMRGYVAGGVSGNYVIHANYAEHDFFRDRPQLDYIENNARAAGYTLLSSTNYKNGIFEGETIRGNHFYTANIAIGLEAHLNKTYSLFFEQAYSHHLKGSAIGPAFDHFFSSTTLVGLRYRILKNSNKVLHTKATNNFR